jgi:hypothetical protein
MRIHSSITSDDDAGPQLLSTPVAAAKGGSPPLSLRIVCAWCEQRERIDGRWLPVRPQTGLLSHGICPDCLSSRL